MKKTSVSTSRKQKANTLVRDAANDDDTTATKRAKIITQSDGEEESAHSTCGEDATEDQDATATTTPRNNRSQTVITPKSSIGSFNNDDTPSCCDNHKSSTFPNSNSSADPLLPQPMTCPDKISALLFDQAAGYTVGDSTNTLKRSDYISWDTYFMAVALLSAQRSKDPIQPAGACLVDRQNRIIGTGYNGCPQGCPDETIPWAAQTDNRTTTPWLHTSPPYVVQPAMNAILNRCTLSCAGATLYAPQFPCHEAAKVMVQSQIAQLVYMQEDNASNSSSIRASRILLELAGVKIRQYTPTQESIVLNFTQALDLTERAEKTPCNPAVTDAEAPSFTKQREILLRHVGYVASTSTKRLDALSWTDYFLGMALLTAQRSKDPNTQVGACIVDDTTQRIVGLGYNGFPTGCSDDVLPWSNAKTAHPLHTKYMYVCHAEVNAILNSNTPPGTATMTTLYVALFPCHECAKMIVQCQTIRTVVYWSDRYHDTDSCKASRAILEMAGIVTRRHVPLREQVTIEFPTPTAQSSNLEQGE